MTLTEIIRDERGSDESQFATMNQAQRLDAALKEGQQ